MNRILVSQKVLLELVADDMKQVVGMIKARQGITDVEIAARTGLSVEAVHQIVELSRLRDRNVEKTKTSLTPTMIRRIKERLAQDGIPVPTPFPKERHVEKKGRADAFKYASESPANTD